MMATSRLNIGINEKLKEQVKEVYSELGMDLMTAVTIFFKQSVRDRALPFQPHLENPDSVLARKQAESGEGETFSSVEEW